MACPDEDTVAQLLQGLLSGDDLARLERHLDGCAACTELVAELGKAFGPETRRSDRPAPARDAVPLARVELFAAFIHVLVTGKLAWLTVTGEALTASHHPAVTAAAFALGVLSGPIGAAVAATAAWSSSRGARWARRAAIAHAVIALPTVILTPLAIYVLVELRSRTSRYSVFQ